jgi:hypothetical protein
MTEKYPGRAATSLSGKHPQSYPQAKFNLKQVIHKRRACCHSNNIQSALFWGNISHPQVTV